MYNGIGLTTPRGRSVLDYFVPSHHFFMCYVCSGTNGYVVRNLSTLRSQQSAQDRAGAWDVAPPKHREPDAEILEHDRKRKVEVQCFELQLKLEDEG